MKILNFLVRRVRKMSDNFQRQKCFRLYADIRKVLVLFDLEQAEATMAFVRELENEGKQVQWLTMQTNAKTPLPSLPDNGRIILLSDLNFKAFPRAEFMEYFKSLNPDTLLDLTVQPHPVLQYLSLLSEASYRVGFVRAEKTMDDLLLEYDAEKGYEFLTGQLHFYLKSLRAT